MSEETSRETQELESTPQEVVATKDDPYLEQAIGMGYNPNRDEFISRGGKEEDFVDAKTFVDRAPFIKQINSLKTKMDKILDFNLKLEQEKKEDKAKAYQKAYADVKAQMKQAAEMGDADVVEQLAERAAEYKQAAETATREVELPPETIKAAKDFVSRNQHWWNSNSDMGESMRLFAKSEEKRLLKLDIAPEKLYEQVEVAVKQRYSDMFSQEISSPRPTISPKSSVSSGKTTSSLKDVPSSVRDIYYTMKEYREKRGLKYSPEEFLESHKDILKNL